MSYYFLSLLTVDLSRGQLPVDAVEVADAVQDVEEGLGQAEEVAEVVETEVDQLAGKFNHLKVQEIQF